MVCVYLPPPQFWILHWLGTAECWITNPAQIEREFSSNTDSSIPNMIDLVSLIRAFTKVVEVFVIECTNLAFIKIISVIVSKVAIRHGGPWCSLLIISPQHNNHSTAHWIFEMAYLKYFLYFYCKYNNIFLHIMFERIWE